MIREGGGDRPIRFPRHRRLGNRYDNMRFVYSFDALLARIRLRLNKNSHGLMISFEFMRLGMLANALKRLRFDLSDAFAGHAEFFSDLFQCVRNTIVEPETHFQNFLLPGRQVNHDLMELVFQ